MPAYLWPRPLLRTEQCGHQAFSDSKTINDSVGWVLHSALLVPVSSVVAVSNE